MSQTHSGSSWTVIFCEATSIWNMINLCGRWLGVHLNVYVSMINQFHRERNLCRKCNSVDLCPIRGLECDQKVWFHLVLTRNKAHKNFSSTIQQHGREQQIGKFRRHFTSLPLANYAYFKCWSLHKKLSFMRIPNVFGASDGGKERGRPTLKHIQSTALTIKRRKS